MVILHISFGYDCGQRDKPGVYTQIVYYLPWIHKKLNKVYTNKNDFCCSW